MNQLTAIWNSMSMAQRVSLFVVPVLLAAAAFGLVRWKHESDFRPIYNSLAPEDASALSQKLRESGVEYRLDETGSTVLVPSGRIAEARLALAGAGLPRTGRIGFELFDRSNLGASDFTEQVNYRRALEGELERTVATLAEIEQARIHITFAKESVFLDSREPAKATVVLKLRRAGALQQSSVTAIANLVAGAVDGLAPQSVAVIDSSGTLLNRPRAAGTDGVTGAASADANLDYRHQVEADMTARIDAALEPLLGAGRFRAGVNVDCDFTSSEESEETFDGAKSAILQSQSTEETTGSATSGGQPGTASNLPRPPEKQASAAGAGVSRRTENISYQPSRTVRKTILPKGSIRRVSTAILLDQTVKWEGAGSKARKTLVPPSPEVMKGVRDVIAGITGFNEQRGDQITVETLPFEDSLIAQQPVTSPVAPKTSHFDIGQPLLVYGGAVILMLILAVLFLLIRRPAAIAQNAAEDTARPGLPQQASAEATLPGAESGTSRLQQQIEDNAAEQAALEEQALSHIKMPAKTKTTEVLVRHIRDAVQKDPVNAANVLRTWVSDSEPKRSS
jgi:flagellar M-ring protein FliF